VFRYRLQYHNPPPFSAHEVLPGIWLGNFEDSLQADELRRRNVTHILSVAVGLYPHHQALVPDADAQVCFVFAFTLSLSLSLFAHPLTAHAHAHAPPHTHTHT
jgi:hypothetical protein